MEIQCSCTSADDRSGSSATGRYTSSRRAISALLRKRTWPRARKEIEEGWTICPPRYPRRLKLEQTRGRDHNPCDEGGEAREHQQIMQDDGHRQSSMQRRGHARISRPEGGGDCYVSAKWGQLAAHRCRVELSGDSSSRSHL